MHTESWGFFEWFLFLTVMFTVVGPVALWLLGMLIVLVIVGFGKLFDSREE